MSNATRLVGRFFISLLVAAVALWAGSARAVTYTWDNSNVAGSPAATLNWFNATLGLWTGPVVPVSNNANTIQFFADTVTPLTNTNTPSVQTSNIDNGTAPFELGALTLSGLASATLNANLAMTISGDPLNFSAATGTINLNALNATRTITYNLNSNIQLGTGSSADALTITGNGTGTFNIGGVISELQSGGGSLTKSGSSTVTLSGANSYSGGTAIDGGRLQFNAGAVPATGAVTINAAGTLLATGAYASAGAWLASGKIATSSSGVIALTAANTVAVDFSAGGYNNLYLGATANSNFGAVTLTPGANGYLLGGGGATLTLNTADTLGAGTNLTVGGNLTISAANSAFDGAVALNAGTLTLGNTAALGSPSAITLAGGTTLSSTALGTVISAPITLGAGTVTVNAPAGIGLTLNGKISGNGNLYLNSTNGGNQDAEILLGAASDYAGDTTFASVYNARLRVKLGIANALPTGTVLTLNGAGTSGTSRNLHFDLNGFDQTVGGLANVSQARMQYAIKNSGATPATLTVSNVADCTYSAPLWFGMNTTPNVNLTKAGAGVLTLSGLSGYSGVTTVNGGVLSVSALADGAILTPTLTVTGNNSANITASDTTGLEVGMVVMCQGIAQNKTIASITDATHFVLNSGTGNAPVGGLVSAIGPANNLGGWGSNDAANLVLNGGTLQYTGPAVSTARNFTLGTAAGSAIDASGSGALTWTGNPTLSGTDTARTFTLTGTNTEDNTFAGAFGDNGTGATSLVKSGPGTWVLTGANTYTGLTTVKAGTLQLATAAQSVVFSGAGADIQGGKMLLDGMPAVLADLKTGYNATGAWTLGQFDSSTADASHGLGWDIVSGQTKVAYTFYGDATLDGSVDSSDLAKVLANYNQTTGMVWGQGDFNYDDAVDSGDLAKVLANYNQTLPSGISIAATSYGQAAAGFNVVPEPSTLVLLAAGLVGLVCYAWRRRRS